MSHESTESFAIVPHNVEASRTRALVPDQLRNQASNLIELLTEYYDYMNEDGIVKALNIVSPGTGSVISYADLLQSTAIVGAECFSFVPSNYNQQYIKLTDVENSALNFGSAIAYRGLTNANYFLLKMDKNVGAGASRTALYNTWVMAYNNNGSLQCDFYDSLADTATGSNTDDVSSIVFRGNSGGSFNTLDTGDAGAFIAGNIDPIALASSVNSQTSIKTTLVNFSNIVASGGHGKGLTLDITADNGKVVSVIPNESGYGYRIDDYMELPILQSSVISVSEVIASPSNVTRRVLQEHDIDKTTDDYIDRIAMEIAKGIPDAKNLDKNALYKKIVEYYNTRGSESSIESFFKIFFDEIVSVSYPKEVLFKTSDGDYQGTSAEAVTKEKYYYKKGYDNMRRLHFYRNSTYADVRQGTYFLDIEFGDDFKLGVSNTDLPNTHAIASFPNTHLFSASSVTGGTFTRDSIKNAGVFLKITSDGHLAIGGRLGNWQNDFNATFNNYVDNSTDYPFRSEINLSKQRLRLAISVDSSRTQASAVGNKAVASLNADANGVTSLTLDTSTVTGTIEAGQYMTVGNAIGVGISNQQGSTVVVSYNTSTGALVVTNPVNLNTGQSLEFKRNEFTLTAVKIAALNTAYASAPLTSSLTNASTSGGGVNTVNLYPGAIGSAYNFGSVGSSALKPSLTGAAVENPDGPLYYYGFSFIPTLASDTEMSNFLSNKVVPQNTIIDIDLDNSGSVNITNKGSSIVVAKAIKGGGYDDNPDVTSIPVIEELNYGLSSSGTAYPRVIRWKDTRGYLSDAMKLHDGDYFQEFSYVVRTKLSVDSWETEFNKLVHPAGMKFFTALFLELVKIRKPYQEDTYMPLGDSVEAPNAEGEFFKPPEFKASDPIGTFRLLQNQVSDGSHSPTYQPGWLEYFYNAYLEIILYEFQSAFFAQKQSQFNRMGDVAYNYEKGLKLEGPSDVLSGNAKKAILDTTDDSTTIDERYIELDGNGTAISTGGELTQESELELKFKLKETSGTSIKGKYLAGTKFRGVADGNFRELSIKGYADNKVEVVVSDYSSTASGRPEDQNDSRVFDAIQCTGTNLNYHTSGHGVKFSDPSVSQETSGNGSGSGDNTYNKRFRGHNVIIFNQTSGTVTSDGDTYAPNKYRHFYFDTYGGSVSGHSTSDEAEHALHDKLKNTESGLIVAIYTYDAAKCKVNATRLGTSVKPTGGYNFDSATGYQYTSGAVGTEGLRWALARYFGAPNRQTEFAQSSDINGERISHSFIGVRNSNTDSSTTVGLDEERCIERISENTGDTAAKTVSLQYQSNTISTAGLSGTPAIPIIRHGPFERDKFYQLPDAEKGLNYSAPLIVDLGTAGTFKTLRVHANGQVMLDDAILRSKKEAASPKNVKEILLENYDFSDAFTSQGFRDIDSLTNRDNSGAIYYDDELNGVVVTGGTRWLNLNNRSIIDNLDTKFEIEVTYKNISNRNIRVYAGLQSLDASNNSLATDRFNTYNWGIASNFLLNAGVEKTFTKTVGGINPPFDPEHGYQDVTTDSASKFDFGAKKFNLVLINNYTNSGALGAHVPSLLIKKVSIKRVDGEAIEFDSIPKYAPEWGIKNILHMNSLDAPQTTFSGSVDLSNTLKESSVSSGITVIKSATTDIKDFKIQFSTGASRYYNLRLPNGEKIGAGNYDISFDFEINSISTGTAYFNFEGVGGHTLGTTATSGTVSLTNLTATESDNRGLYFYADDSDAVVTITNFTLIRKTQVLPALLDSGTVNGVKTNSIAIGTLNRNQKLSGLHEVDDSFTDTNLLSPYLPWTPGDGDNIVNGSQWSMNGSAEEQLRSISTGPFGEKEVTWIAKNSSTDNAQDGGYHSPYVEVNPYKDHKFTFPFKIKSRAGNDGNIYFGVYNAEEAGSSQVGGGRNVGDVSNSSTDIPLIDLAEGSETGLSTYHTRTVQSVTCTANSTIVEVPSSFSISTGNIVLFKHFSNSDFDSSNQELNHGSNYDYYYINRLSDADNGNKRIQLFTNISRTTNKITNGGNAAVITSFVNNPQVVKIGAENRYFLGYNLQNTQLESNKWYLVSGYIKATRNVTSDDNARPTFIEGVIPDFVGVWDYSTGKKIENLETKSFQLASTETRRLLVRAYQFYNATSSADEIEFGTPTVEVLDGTERAHEECLTLPKHRVSQYPASINVASAALVNKSTLTGGNTKEFDFRYTISEHDRGATDETVSGESYHAYEAQPITSIPATETSGARPDVIPNGAVLENKILNGELKNAILNAGGNALVLKSGGIKNVDDVSNGHSNILYSGLTATAFTLTDSDYTTSHSGVGAKLLITFGKAGNHYYARSQILEPGCNFREGEIITIADAKIGSSGAPALQIKVSRLAPGKISIPDSTKPLSLVTKPVTFTLEDSISTDSTELNSIGDNRLFDKEVEYEVNFDCKRLYDYNFPSNLYIGGGDKIGSYHNLFGYAGMNNARGNPHVPQSSGNGDGPHEFIFHSSAEGFARIFLSVKEVENGWRLAHNGHTLRVKNTNSDRIGIAKIPQQWQFNNQTISIPDDNFQMDHSARLSADNEAHHNYDGVFPGALNDYGLFMFETEWLTYGENVIQFYSVSGDGMTGAFIEVLPAGANNGLVRDGANKHVVYMDSNTANSKIVLDNVTDRDATRYTGRSVEASAIVNAHEKKHAFAYKLENLNIRKKRKLIYKGKFQSIVADPPVTFTGSVNTDPNYGTAAYRPLDVSSITAVDGALATGGQVIVPSIETYDSDAQVGNKKSGSTLYLGIPKGNYGVLKFIATSQNIHYVDFGSDRTIFPYDVTTGDRTYTPNTQYEISGQVFIPSGNSKLQKLCVMAGVNPRKLSETRGQPVSDANGNPLFKNTKGTHQINTGPCAGFDYLSTDKTVITTKGSWVPFTHKFFTRSDTEDPTPVFRFVSNLNGNAIPERDVAAYSGDASGEYFYIKSLRVKEGVDPDLAEGKEIIDARRETIINVIDRRKYDLKSNTPGIGEDSLFSTRIKFGAATNTYKLRMGDNTKPYSNSLLTLDTLNGQESNLLAGNLPFPLNASTLTASYGNEHINIHTTTSGNESNTPADLINSPNFFTPVGNPTKINSGSSNSPYTTTYENIGKMDLTPFGGRDAIWEARNTDNTFRVLRKFTRTTAGTGFTGASGGKTYSNVPIIDTGSKAVGKGGLANVIVQNSGVIQSVTMVSGKGGFNYGRNQTAIFGIPMKFAVGPKFNAASARDDATKDIPISELVAGQRATVKTVGNNSPREWRSIHPTGLAGTFTPSVGDIFTATGPLKDYGLSTLPSNFETNGMGTVTVSDAYGDSPEAVSAKINGNQTAPSIAGKSQVTGTATSTTNYNIGNSPATTMGAIEPGMRVTGTGISGTVTVASVNYEGTKGDNDTGKSVIPIVLSQAATISNNTTLTFRPATRTINLKERAAKTGTVGSGVLKAGMKETLYIGSPLNIKSIVHQSPGQTQVVTDYFTNSLTDGQVVAYEDPLFGLEKGTGEVIKGNISEDPTGDDSPGNVSTNFSYFDGGFRTPSVAVDSKRMYRFSVWVKQSDTTFSADSPGSSSYTSDMGAHKIIRWRGATDAAITTPLEVSNGNTQTPIGTFINDFDIGPNSATSVAESAKGNNDKWLLFVAHIHPASTDPTGFSAHADSGIYLAGNTNKISTVTNTKQGDWIFSSNIAHIKVDCLIQGNPRNTEDPVQFYSPRVDLVDGSEPSLKELVEGEFTYKTNLQMTSKEIPVISWRGVISDNKKTLGEYFHAIEDDKFSVKLNESFTVNNKTTNYTDIAEEKFTPIPSSTDSVFNVNFSAANGFTGTNASIILPLQNVSGAMGAFVDWGDGSTNIIKFTGDKDLYHTYTGGVGNTYDIKISGSYHVLNSSSTTSASSSTASSSAKTTARANWKNSLETAYIGNNPFSSTGMITMFKDCVKLKSVTTVAGVTNTSAVTDMTSAFENCSALVTLDMRGMDTSNVTTMANLAKLSSATSGTLKVIGLHSRNINSLVRGTAGGLKDAFLNNKINTDELNRCYLTWSQNSSLPSGVFITGAITGGTATAAVTAKINQKFAKAASSVASGSNTITLKDFTNGETQTIADLAVGDIVKSQNAGFPSGMTVVIGSIVGNVITIVRQDNGAAANLTQNITTNVQFQFPSIAGHTVIPVDTFTGASGNAIGSIEVGMTVDMGDADFPNPGTVTAVGARTITITPALTSTGDGVVGNNSNLVFTSNKLKLTGTLSGTIVNGMTVSGTGISGTPKVTDATNQAEPVISAVIAAPGTNAMTIQFTDADKFNAHFGSSNYKNILAKTTQLDSSATVDSVLTNPVTSKAVLTTSHTSSASSITGKNWIITDGGVV